MSNENTKTTFKRVITDWQNLNQHHDILHDFSYQNMAGRLKKIGMAIHKSAVTISGVQGGGQAGGQRGGTLNDEIKRKLNEIEDSVSLESYYSDLLITFFGQNEFPVTNEYATAIKGISTIQNNISQHWYDDGFILFKKRSGQDIAGDNISYPRKYLTKYFQTLETTYGETNDVSRYDLRSGDMTQSDQSNAYRTTDIVDIWNNFMYKESYIELGYLNAGIKNVGETPPTTLVTSPQFRSDIVSSTGGDPTQVLPSIPNNFNFSPQLNQGARFAQDDLSHLKPYISNKELINIDSKTTEATEAREASDIASGNTSDINNDKLFGDIITISECIEARISEKNKFNNSIINDNDKFKHKMFKNFLLVKNYTFRRLAMTDIYDGNAFDAFKSDMLKHVMFLFTIYQADMIILDEKNIDTVETNFNKIIDKFIFENTTSILDSIDSNTNTEDNINKSEINEEEKVRMHKKMRDIYEKKWRKQGERKCKKDLSKQNPDIEVTQDTKYKNCVDDYIDTNKNDKKYCIWYDNCEKSMKGGANTIIKQSSFLKGIVYNPTNWSSSEIPRNNSEQDAEWSQILNLWVFYNYLLKYEYNPRFIDPLLKIAGRNSKKHPYLLSLYTSITKGVSSTNTETVPLDYDILLQDMNNYIKAGDVGNFENAIDAFWTKFTNIINKKYTIAIDIREEDKRESLSIMDFLIKLDTEAKKDDRTSFDFFDMKAMALSSQTMRNITSVNAGGNEIYENTDPILDIEKQTGWPDFRATFPCNVYWGEDTRNSITKTTGTNLIKALDAINTKNENWLYKIYIDVKTTQSRRRKMSKVQELINGFEKWIKTDFFDVISSRLEWFKSSQSKDITFLNKSLLEASQLAIKERERRETELAKLPDGKSMTSEGRQLVNWVVRLAAANGLTALGYVNDPRESGQSSDNITNICRNYIISANKIIQTIESRNSAIFNRGGDPEQDFFNELFSALCGIEIFILWHYAFTESNTTIGNISTDIPGSGQLDDRLLTSFIEIFAKINKNRNIPANNRKQLGLISQDEYGATGWDINKIFQKYMSIAIPKFSGQNPQPTKSQRIVINNAATLLHGMEQSTNVICTDSSIVDGMSQCSFDSAENVRYGQNMNWTTQDEDETTFYTGIFKGLNELRNKKGGSGTFKIAKLMIELYINNNIGANETQGDRGSVQQERHYFSESNVNLSTGKELEANYVYKNVLNELVLIFQEYGTTADTMWIWENLSDPQNAGEFDRNRRFMNEILKKGAGDLFQEVNSSLIAGGYDLNETPYINTNNEIPVFGKTGGYNAPGRTSNWPFAVRMGMMGDRPSGSRPVIWNMASNSGYIIKSETSGDDAKIWYNPLFSTSTRGLTNVYNASGYYYDNGGMSKSFFTINTTPYNFTSMDTGAFRREWYNKLINLAGGTGPTSQITKGYTNQFVQLLSSNLINTNGYRGGGKRKTRKRKYRKSRRKSKKSKKKRKSRKKRRKTNKRK